MHVGKSPVLDSEEQSFTKTSLFEPQVLSHARCMQSKSIHQMGKIVNCQQNLATSWQATTITQTRSNPNNHA